MKIEFLSRFKKDVRNINENKVRSDIESVISNCKSAADISEINNLSKISGYKNAYRIRKGDYRVGVYITGDTVEFVRVLHRKDIYKKFP